MEWCYTTRGMRIAELALAALLLAQPPLAAAQQKEHWRDVDATALPSLFGEKEFGDGVHFAYQFKRDGTFTGTEMGKRVSGVWRVQRNAFCWKWVRPPDAEECYQVQQDGAHVRMLRNGA